MMSKKCFVKSMGRWSTKGLMVLPNGLGPALSDARAAPRGAPDDADPNPGARRHAQDEVPELVPRALPRPQCCPLRTCPRRLTPRILVLSDRPRGSRRGEATRCQLRPSTQDRHASHQASLGDGPVADTGRPRDGRLTRNRLQGQGELDGHRVAQSPEIGCAPRS